MTTKLAGLPSRTASALAVLSLSLALGACGGGGDDAPVPPPAPADPNTVATANGPVKGTERTGMRSFFAIPFAKPPVGALRWTAPQAPDHWTTPREATKSAAPCLQTSASPFRLADASEDCLYLDVHAPTGVTGPLPVMVWIHGGAFNTGGTATYFDPSPLVSKGVIVVNIAYRLGAMGFLGHPALADSNGAAGNYGMMDQQAALAWVQANIAAFGGDKANVTIFGESAGGMSVMTHLASPGSEGLFAKAIVQSGAYGANTQLTAAQLQATSTTVVTEALAAANVTCDTVDAACLRALPADVVSTQLAASFNKYMSSPVPSVDGKVLTETVKSAFQAGRNHPVPMINGTNEDEYRLFVAIGEMGRRATGDTTPALTPAEFSASVQGLIGAQTAPLVEMAYPLASYGSDPLTQPSLALSAVGTDLVFACNALQLSRRVGVTQAAPIWMYEFRDQTAPAVIGNVNGSYAVSFPQGAAHSYELQYLFNTTELATDEQRALKNSLTQYWTNFARTGNPSTGGTVPAWSAFTAGAPVVQRLDVQSGGGITASTAAAFEAQHKCATFWTGLTF